MNDTDSKKLEIRNLRARIDELETDSEVLREAGLQAADDLLKAEARVKEQDREIDYWKLQSEQNRALAFTHEGNLSLAQVEIEKLQSKVQEQDREIARLRERQKWLDEVDGPPKYSEDSRPWIPAYLNAKEAFRKAGAEREKLIEMLEKYGRHTDDCDIGFDGDPVACSCGLDAVLAEVKEQP